MGDRKEPETFTFAHCSFCGNRQDQVIRLTLGPGHLSICNECVDFCREVLEQRHLLSQRREVREWQTERTEVALISEPIHLAYEAIRQTALDDVEGMEDGDPTRIERSIHSDLKTRRFMAAEGSAGLIRLTITELLELRNASRPNGKVPKAARTDRLICDLGERIAPMRLTTWWGTDSLHLAKDQEHWMIENRMRTVYPQNNDLDTPHGSV